MSKQKNDLPNFDVEELPLFDRIYDNPDEMSKQDKDIERTETKMLFKQALMEARKRINSLDRKSMSEMQKLSEMDINSIMENDNEIRILDIQIGFLEVRYESLFGEKLTLD